jgi:hypothetical protein
MDSQPKLLQLFLTTLLSGYWFKESWQCTKVNLAMMKKKRTPK